MLRKSKIVLGIFGAAVFLSSCHSLKKLSYSDYDDTYLDPHKDRAMFYNDVDPKSTSDNNKTVNNSNVATANNMDPNNPYYKDKAFNYDDYYDNEYASRIRRFHNPTNGMGYYDSYYTNSYFYNNNPYHYGVSIYNGYSFWPSYNNYMYVPNYNWGGYYGYGTYMGYNNYCNSGYYNPGYYNNYYNNWYNPYGYNNMYSCYSSWNNPYYFNNYGYSNYYGYNNSYDNNSTTYYGPRVSHSGGNSKDVINPGMGLNKQMAPSLVNGSEPKEAVNTGFVKPNPNSTTLVQSPDVTMNQNGATANTPHTMSVTPTSNPSTPANNNENGGGLPKTHGFFSNQNTAVSMQPANTPHTIPNNPKAMDNSNSINVQPVSNNNSDPTPKPKTKWFQNESNNSGNSNPNQNNGYNNNSSMNNSGGGNNYNTKPSYNPPANSGGGGGNVVHPSGTFKPRK